MKILITGSNGVLGSQISEQLSKETQIKTARRVTKNIEDKKNIETVYFDYDDLNSYEKALENVDRVLLMAPPLDFTAYERLLPFITKLKEKNIKKVILISVIGAENDDTTPLRKIELELIKEDFEYVFLRPNFFMEAFSIGGFSSLKSTSKLVLNANNGKTSFISVEDIAQVATKIFIDDSFDKSAYTLTGTDCLSMEEVVEIISEKLNKKITYTNISKEEMKKGLIELGIPDSNAEFLVMLLDFVAKGYLSPISNDIENILGKKPLSFKEFVSKNFL